MTTNYESRIRSRNFLHFLAGLIARIPSYLKFRYSIMVARKRGAIIGKDVTMPISVARKFDSHVTIDNHVSFNHDVDFTALLNPLHIGHHVIIGQNVNFILTTHDIDSLEWEHIQPSKGLEIEPYVWICPNAIILPSVKRIGFGAVIGAGSVVTKDIPPMSVVAGNPAKKLRNRKCVHANICIESLRGGDLLTYIKTWK